jgi:hypothetical protein
MRTESVEQDQARDERVYEEVDGYRGPAQVASLIAVVAGAVTVILGIVATARIEWSGMTSAQLDEPMSEVMDMTFTPILAIGTIVLGLLLILVAATRAGTAEMVLGAILAAVGVAILAVEDVQASWNVQDRHGVLALGIGAVFVLAGLITDRGFHVRRSYTRHAEVR